MTFEGDRYAGQLQTIQRSATFTTDPVCDAHWLVLNFENPVVELLQVNAVAVAGQ